MSQPYVRMPLEVLQQWIGKPIHLAGYGKGCVWIVTHLESRYGEWFVHLRTPKTNKYSFALASRAQYTRKHQPKGEDHED